MCYRISNLPYVSLEPQVSDDTLEQHYEHHRKELIRLNLSVERKGLTGWTVEDLIRTQRGALFRHAAQVWNHVFYWNSIFPGGVEIATDSMREAIDRDFGGGEALRRRFKEAALSVFGSGWAWLVHESRGGLAVMTTRDMDCPLRTGERPLLACDLWEHAYVRDYDDRRGAYVDAWWEIVDWSFAEDNLRQEAHELNGARRA